MTNSADALAARLAGLSPAQRAQLARRLAGKGTPGATVIPVRAADAPVPLSFAQWRLWFLEQLRPGTNAWNTAIAARLSGRLDVEALRRAIETVVEHQPTLRTVFAAPRGVAQPVVVPSPEVVLPVVDLASLDDVDADVRMRAHLDAEVRRPFDLASDLMVRASLVRMAADDHVLVLVLHHIACDGWSKQLFLAELSTAYNAAVAGAAAELPDLPVHYADFAVWQRACLSGENLERLSAYWREQLRGHAAAVELPADHPRPSRQSFLGATEPVAVSRAVADAAVAVGRAERATPFMTMLAAFMLLLRAHTGQDDLLVGSPAAMRDVPQLEPVIGFFANTLVYRTDLCGDPTFRDVIGRVRETAVEAYRHQDLPFEKVVEAVNPPRDLSRNPIVQVNMRLEGREPELRLDGIRATPIDIDPGIARFDLAIELGATDDGYAGYLEYDTALFEHRTARTYADDFVALLEAATDAPDVPMSQLRPVRAITDRSRVRIA